METRKRKKQADHGAAGATRRRVKIGYILMDHIMNASDAAMFHGGETQGTPAFWVYDHLASLYQLVARAGDAELPAEGAKLGEIGVRANFQSVTRNVIGGCSGLDLNIL